jgi:HlyD family type I secretion membrane fusion protein
MGDVVQDQRLGKQLAPYGGGYPLPRPIEVARAPRYHGAMVLGLAVMALFAGGFGVWAATAPLSAAATAPGQVKVEGNRRTIQHLEGGIIREILVKEGDRVAGGQTLLRLDDTQSSASADTMQNQLDALRALDARLTAERQNDENLAFPADLAARRGDPKVAEILQGQEAIFRTRQLAYEGQTSILRQRIEQLRAQIRANEAQMTAMGSQLKLIREEITSVEDLVQKGYERRPRLLQLQRNEAQLLGSQNEQRGLIARSQQAIGETELQIVQLRTQFRNEIVNEQRDVQSKIAEMNDKLRAASDVLERREVISPVAGTVTNLRFFTVGGVIKPGDSVLDVIPLNEQLVIECQVNPTDIDIVGVGMDAEVRLTAFKQRVIPVLMGRVVNVSPDIFQQERTGAPYYKATVNIDPSQLVKLEGLSLQPGMPAEVLILSGERTMFRYLADPIRQSFRRAFREQ